MLLGFIYPPKLFRLPTKRLFAHPDLLVYVVVVRVLTAHPVEIVMTTEDEKIRRVLLENISPALLVLGVVLQGIERE
jgi:hypothetical protein